MPENAINDCMIVRFHALVFDKTCHNPPFFSPTLSHPLPLGKMAAILHMTLSNAFSRMNFFIYFEFNFTEVCYYRSIWE